MFKIPIGIIPPIKIPAESIKIPAEGIKIQFSWYYDHWYFEHWYFDIDPSCDLRDTARAQKPTTQFFLQIMKIKNIN